MKAHSADFERSLARAPARRRVLMTMASMSIAYPAPLARAAAVQPHRLMALMYGQPPRYRRELGLVPLGLVREVVGPNGRAFEITSRGRRKARQVAARTLRREAQRGAAQSEVAPRVEGGAPAAEATAAPAGVAPPVPLAAMWSFTWVG